MGAGDWGRQSWTVVPNPLDTKKLQLWCDSVRARAENMLPSSLNTPATAELLSSEELTVMMLPADSATAAESVSDNDSDRDAEEEDDFSDNDLDLLSEQSDTTDVTDYGISTCTVSGGTEVPVKKTN